MSDMDTNPVELEEPEMARSDEGREDQGIWMRGLMMLILALLFALAETVLVVVAVVQFLWMLFSKERNQMLAEFGQDLGEWLAATARFQSGASDDKPFPWASWR